MSEGRTDLVTRVEFPSGSMEDFAMQKVIDPISNSNLYVIHSLPSDTLESILEKGVYTEEYAKRIGDESYLRNYDAEYNKKFISTREGSMEVWGINRRVALMISSDRVTEEEIAVKTDGEKLIHRRAKPKDFLGLLCFPADFRGELDTSIKIWRQKPQHSLPIYAMQDRSLLWPIMIPNEQINKMLKERKKNEV